MLLDSKGIARLLSNQDFVTFVGSLNEEYARCLQALLNSSNPAITSQLQGETRKLVELIEAIKASQPALPRAT